MKLVKIFLALLFTLNISLSVYSQENKASEDGKIVDNKGNNKSQLIKNIDEADERDVLVYNNKSTAKTLKPLPEELFTETRFFFGLFGQRLMDDKINNDLSNYNSSFNKFDYMAGAQFGLLWNIYDFMGIGFTGMLSFNMDTNNINGNIETISLANRYLGVMVSVIPYMDEDFILDVQLSGGVMFASIEHDTIYIDDSHYGNANYTRKYQGASGAGSLALVFSYRLNKVWSLGLGFGYFYGKVDKLEDEAGNRVGGGGFPPTDYDMSGGFFTIQTQISAF